MGEEVHMSDFCSPNLDDIEEDVEEERVMEWEVGLPNPDDVTPLCQSLIPPQLASAFSISPEPNRTLIDVHRASQNTLTNLRTGSHQSQNQAFSSNNLPDPIVDDDGIEEDQADQADLNDSRKLRKVDCTEEADSALRNGTTENNNSADDPSGGGARTLKRPRLVWTPQLHRRFVDVVTRIGIRSAVPKTIMQMMNVEGLTRENVASHLQKYRLYLKRMQGLSSEGPSSSDHLFASIPVPNDQSGGTNASAHSHSHHHHHGNGHVPMPIPMMYPPQPMMPMPVMGMHHGHGHGHMGMGMVNNNGFESHPYNMMQQRDWSGNNNPHVTTNDK